MGLAGAVAEDAEAECIRRITETQIVTGWHISKHYCCSTAVFVNMSVLLNVDIFSCSKL